MKFRIKFANLLPRMRSGECGDVRCGTYNNGELSLPGALTTSDSRLGLFLQKLRETLMSNRRLVFVDGKVVVCNHNWIRDHVHQMKGWKHWESDPLSFLQLIIDTQRADGQFFELVKQMYDPHWDMVGPESQCRRHADGRRCRFRSLVLICKTKGDNKNGAPSKAWLNL